MTTLQRENYAFLFRLLRWVPVLKEVFTHRIICEPTK